MADKADRELTARQVEVLTLVAEGWKNDRIGSTLYISEETVKSHMRHILSVLGAHNRAHAVAIWLRSGEARDDLAPVLLARAQSTRAMVSDGMFEPATGGSAPWGH